MSIIKSIFMTLTSGDHCVINPEGLKYTYQRLVR